MTFLITVITQNFVNEYWNLSQICTLCNRFSNFWLKTKVLRCVNVPMCVCVYRYSNFRIDIYIGQGLLTIDHQIDILNAALLRTGTQ